MSRVHHWQANMNGGEISKRLRSRIDLNSYDISLDSANGFIPLIEGGLDACPGLIYVAAELGPFRTIPFNFNRTQGYIITASANKFRFYTNDTIIENDGVPFEVDTPYSYNDILTLTWAQDFDVLYLYHRNYPTMQLIRTSADVFELQEVEWEAGPFEPRNNNEAIRVSSSAISGNTTLTANADIFDVGDVGGLFQMEASDFGSITAWTPGITVSNGTLLTWAERVYRVSGGTGRTGTLAPIHTEGVEWDGIGSGKDINDQDAGGVQLEYLHDRIGILRITSYSGPRSVSAVVTKRLPFTASQSFTFGGGYNNNFNDYVPPQSSLQYAVGTWRWSFGAFSRSRGFPTCGTFWGGRHIVAKDSGIYGSTVNDYLNYDRFNELGDVSIDQAFIEILSDSNNIVALSHTDYPLAITAGASYRIIPSNAASGLGAGNIRAELQYNRGGRHTMTAKVGQRVVYIDSAERSVFEAEGSNQRQYSEDVDLSRYARHFGDRGFVEVAEMRVPHRLLWTVLSDGGLAAVNYVPDEQVLGWFRRELPSGCFARSIAAIVDPAGKREQLHVAVECDGEWALTRIAPFRDDSQYDETYCMVDMGVEYQGVPATNFGPVAHFADKVIDVVADGRAYLDVQCDDEGRFSIKESAEHVWAGFRFPAYIKTLEVEAGGDNGPARSKLKRIVRVTLELLNSRGLRLSVPGADLHKDLNVMQGNDIPVDARAPMNGFIISDDLGFPDRDGAIIIERIAPFQSTVTGIGKTVEVGRK